MTDKKGIGSILKGKLFDADFLIQNIKLISLLVALAFVSAFSSHMLDQKIYEIDRLQKQVRELKSEFVSVRTQLMNRRMSSKLQEEVREMGLETSTVPPHVIKVKKEN